VSLRDRDENGQKETNAVRGPHCQGVTSEPSLRGDLR